MAGRAKLRDTVARENERSVESMRAYWDERARENAAWYVDTSLDFTAPDMVAFFDTGRLIVEEALHTDGAPAPAGRGLAIEIGSGLGRVCKALSGRFDRVVGVDVSAEMVGRAREVVDEANVEFVLGDGSSLASLGDGEADLVLSFTVFQHIPDVGVIHAYIGEAGRVLRGGGVFVFQWNNEPGALRWRLRRAALGVLQRTGIRPEERKRHDPAFLGSRVPLWRIERAATEAGLEIVHMKGLGSLYAWAWVVKR